MTIDPALFIIVAGLALLAGGLVGWDLAVHDHRRTRKLLQISVADLEAQAASFREEMDVDPQRAWINMGKRNVVNQMEATLQTIRTTLEPD